MLLTKFLTLSALKSFNHFSVIVSAIKTLLSFVAFYFSAKGLGTSEFGEFSTVVGISIAISAFFSLSLVTVFDGFYFSEFYSKVPSEVLYSSFLKMSENSYHA